MVGKIKPRRNDGKRKHSAYDKPPPPYTGPIWIGKPITPQPEPSGPDWIGKRIPYRVNTSECGLKWEPMSMKRREE